MKGKRLRWVGQLGQNPSGSLCTKMKASIVGKELRERSKTRWSDGIKKVVTKMQQTG